MSQGKAPTHGAILLENGQTRFSLWAPNAQDVSVELKNDRTLPLERETDGWFRAQLDCPAGTLYRFVINGSLTVPDPASRAQIGDLTDFSCVVDPYAYQWSCTDWHGRPWHESIIYELHAGLLGGFAALHSQLPYLKQLGITAIELMPLGEFPGARNWGYDGVLPFAPESAYGSPDDLRAFIDAAHAHGLMVYVDVVYNHFGPDGNYLHEYAEDFFRADIETPWGPSIDFRRREVRDFFCENALMWLMDYRVDGLRLDAVHAISEKDFLLELASRVREATGAARHVHLILENEDNSASLLEQGFDAQWNDDGHNVLHHLLTGEHEGYYADFVSDPTGKLARCLREGFIFQGEHSRHGSSRGESSAHLPPSSFVLFLQNHDQIGNRAFGERLVTLADAEALKASTVLLLLSPMIPLLFMGEEWGSKKPFLYFTAHHEELAEAVREGRQEEFSEFTEFGSKLGEESLPDPNSIDTFSACRPDFDAINHPEHEPWYQLYSQLLALRHQHIIPRLAGARSAGVRTLADRAVSACWRMGDDSLLRIAVNLNSSAIESQPLSDGAEILFSHRTDIGTNRMAPNSALVILETAYTGEMA